MSKLKINIELELPDEWNITDDDICDNDLIDPQIWLNVIALLTEREQVEINNYDEHSVTINLENYETLRFHR